MHVLQRQTSMMIFFYFNVIVGRESSKELQMDRCKILLEKFENLCTKVGRYGSF